MNKSKVVSAAVYLQECTNDVEMEERTSRSTKTTERW